MAKRRREMPWPVLVLLGLAMVLLSPFLFLFAGWQAERSRKRCLARAATFYCPACGELIGQKSVELAEEAAAAEWEHLQRENPEVYFERAPVADALCRKCGKAYTFDEGADTFTPFVIFSRQVTRLSSAAPK